jgi:putative DNA primase/helicase
MFFCTVCGPGDGFKLLQDLRGIGFREAYTLAQQMSGSFEKAVTPAKFKSRASDLNRMWRQARAVKDGDPVDTYLQARGLSNVREASIRYLSCMVYRHDDGSLTEHPGMLSLVRDQHGLGATLHRTYLNYEGGKADVPCPKKNVKGHGTGAIRLGGIGSVVGVAEGIETALSVSRLFNLPCWAAVNTDGMVKFKPPKEVKSVIIFADNDANYSGHAAAYNLAHRLNCSGMAASVEFPDEVDTDWNDVLLAKIS